MFNQEGDYCTTPNATNRLIFYKSLENKSKWNFWRVKCGYITSLCYTYIEKLLDVLYSHFGCSGHNIFLYSLLVFSFLQNEVVSQDGCSIWHILVAPLFWWKFISSLSKVRQRLKTMIRATRFYLSVKIYKLKNIFHTWFTPCIT